MPITALPTPPSTADPLNFDSRADAFLGALPVFATEANSLATTVNGNATTAAADAATSTAAAAAAAASAASALLTPGTSATDAASLTIATGSLSLTIDQTGKDFVVGQWVSISETANPSVNWMLGAITAFTSGTGAMTVDVVSKSGTGSVSGWTIAAASPAVVVTSAGAIILLNDYFGIF